MCIRVGWKRGRVSSGGCPASSCCGYEKRGRPKSQLFKRESALEYVLSRILCEKSSFESPSFLGLPVLRRLCVRTRACFCSGRLVPAIGSWLAGHSRVPGSYRVVDSCVSGDFAGLLSCSGKAAGAIAGFAVFFFFRCGNAARIPGGMIFFLRPRRLGSLGTAFFLSADGLRPRRFGSAAASTFTLFLFLFASSLSVFFAFLPRRFVPAASISASSKALGFRPRRFG